jgi:hypothetical protein
MEKRPTSMTVISVVLIIFTLFGAYGLISAGTNPIMTKMLTQMHVSLPLYQAYGALGIIISLACAYGIFKGLPWGRVLYLVWGIIGLVVGLYISPIKAALVVSLVLLVIICGFLWTNTANDWFQARGLMLKRERSR